MEWAITFLHVHQPEDAWECQRQSGPCSFFLRHLLSNDLNISHKHHWSLTIRCCGSYISCMFSTEFMRSTFSKRGQTAPAQRDTVWLSFNIRLMHLILSWTLKRHAVHYWIWVLSVTSNSSIFITNLFSFADGKIFVSYSAGDDVCGNGRKAETVIQLTCGRTVGHPSLLR